MRIGKSVVAIFARHLDYSIMKPNLSLIYLIRDFGSGQIYFTETILSFAGICKNCAREVDSNILLNLYHDSKKTTYNPIDSTEGK
jgi:hypothetical protein